jgi:hypothetical protein
MKRFANLEVEWVNRHQGKLLVLLSFVVPLAVRAVPEILMGQFLVGYDGMAYYVPYTTLWLKGLQPYGLSSGGGIWNFIGLAPLLYGILLGIGYAGLPLVMSLKVVSPLLLGFLGLSVYFYANKSLAWSPKKSSLVSLVSTIYFVSLRISWDLFRTELSLIFLFLAMALLTREKLSFRNAVLLSLAMFLVVFSNQLVALVMFAIVLITIIKLSFSKQLAGARKLVICLIPSVASFCLVIYAAFQVSQISVVNGLLNQGTSGLSPVFGFTSVANSALNTAGFVAFCYVPLLPFLLFSFTRFRSNLQVKTWILFIFVAVLVSVVIPNNLVGASPYRWVLLLTYPLAFVVVDVLSTFKSKLSKISGASILLLVLVLLSSSFIALSAEHPLSYFSSYPDYVPTSMLQNTLPLSDCQNAVKALQWAKSNMSDSSVLLTSEAFYGFASLTLNPNQYVFYGYSNVTQFAEKFAVSSPNYNIYMIWWVNGTGWYGQTSVPSIFHQLHQNGNIAIYSYQPT